MGQRSGMSGLVGGLVAVASALLLVTACDDDDSGSGGDTTQACDGSLDVAGIDASFSGTPCAGSFTVANCPSGGPSPNDADLSCSVSVDNTTTTTLAVQGVAIPEGSTGGSSLVRSLAASAAGGTNPSFPIQAACSSQYTETGTYYISVEAPDGREICGFSSPYTITVGP